MFLALGCWCGISRRNLWRANCITILAPCDNEFLFPRPESSALKLLSVADFGPAFHFRHVFTLFKWVSLSD